MLSGDKQSEPPTPHFPPQKSGHANSNGVKIRPLDKDYNLNQQIPPGILLGLSSSSKGIKDSNGHTAIHIICIYVGGLVTTGLALQHSTDRTSQTVATATSVPVCRLVCVPQSRD